ncbi:MAG: hypothetical protein EAZ06_01430 [Cytophagales bacterium]|nr:MAG: hypothetical protein EAZ06_01430 [Cytophagales bacterium]
MEQKIQKNEKIKNIDEYIVNKSKKRVLRLFLYFAIGIEAVLQRQKERKTRFPKFFLSFLALCFAR